MGSLGPTTHVPATCFIGSAVFAVFVIGLDGVFIPKRTNFGWKNVCAVLLMKYNRNSS
jgi:hypothetical protein